MGENGLLNVLVSSKMRRDILLFLDDGPKTLPQIKDHVGAGSPQLSSKIRELLDYRLISSERKTYSLTAQGRIVLANYWPLYNTIDLFERHGEYWKSHDLNSIPQELRHRIGDLHNSEHIEDDMEDLNRTLRVLVDILRGAGKVSGASPAFEEQGVQTLIQVAKSGIPVEIVLSRVIYNRLLTEHSDIAREIAACSNFDIYVTEEPITTPFILTDRYLYFSTYYCDGTFDTQSNLVSSDPAAVHWGQDLFSYYLARSVKVSKVEPSL